MIHKQLAPANTNNTDFWSPVDNGSRGVCELVIANVTTASTTARVFADRERRTWADEHAVMYGHPIPANDERVIRVDTSDFLAIQSGTANALTFTLRSPVS